MIDGGPLRTSRPAGRRVTYRDESVRYQPEEIQPEEQPAAMPIEPQRHREPQQQYRQAEPMPVQAEPKAPRSFSWVKWPIVGLIIIALGVAGWYLRPMGTGLEATIDNTKYQAVFLSNGQVYFGKLSVVNGDYLKLINVYYLERQLTTTGNEGETDNQASTENPTNENNFQLLKYSDVLYGSEDAMIISKDDVIRYENLRSDGVVAKAIANRS